MKRSDTECSKRTAVTTLGPTARQCTTDRGPPLGLEARLPQAEVDENLLYGCVTCNLNIALFTPKAKFEQPTTSLGSSLI